MTSRIARSPGSRQLRSETGKPVALYVYRGDDPPEYEQYPVESPGLYEKCGTYAGWNAHKRRSEIPCDACLNAQRTYIRQRRAQGKDSWLKSRGYGGCVRGLGWPREPG